MKIAIFDLDGTLLDTLDDLTDAVNHAMEAHGFPCRTREEVRNFIGNGVGMLIRRAAPTGTAEDILAEALAKFKAFYAENCRCKTAPYAGIMDLLEELRARDVVIAVASNKFDAAVRALCEHYFGDRVEVAVGEDIERGIRRKPAPDSVEEVLRRLGGRKEDAVYIGDSDTDIKTAQNAGIPCISVTWGFRDEIFLREMGARVFAREPMDVVGEMARRSRDG